MPLKIKLKVNPSKPSKVKNEPENDTPKPLPRLKIKQPSASTENVGRVSKVKSPKEKLKKLKISLGKAGSAPTPSHTNANRPNGHVQPVPKKVPKVRIKPTRVPGEGYDSEAPDIEDDPLLEQAIAIRFLDDANLDFLHSAADTGDFSNVNIKWITRDKAVVNVNSTLYSARLIDMPTLTELYKTVDKKNIFKTIDVSQVLLVLRVINPKNLSMETDFEVPEENTYTHPLYKLSVNKEVRPTKTAYRHGLSNSFDDVYRRFRPKKTNHRLMTDIESRVEEIVRRDADAQESHYEYVNPKSSATRYPDTHAQSEVLQRTSSSVNVPHTTSQNSEIGANTTERELDDEDDNESDQMALDLEADLDNALEQELADALDSTSNTAAATVLMKSEYDTGEQEADEGDITGANDEENEEDEDEDEDDDDEDEDEDTKQDTSRAKKLEEEIADLQKAADKQKVLLAAASYKMMRMKFQSAYNNLKSQLDSKKRELVKIHEQQSKSLVPKEGRMGISRADSADEEEDEEDEDEDGGDSDEDMGEKEEAQSEGIIEDSAGNESVGIVGGDEDVLMDEGNEEDNYDDFQGLF